VGVWEGGGGGGGVGVKLEEKMLRGMSHTSIRHVTHKFMSLV